MQKSVQILDNGGNEILTLHSDDNPAPGRGQSGYDCLFE